MIAGDGTVSAKAANGRPAAVGRLKLVVPESPAALTRGSDGLFRAQSELPAEASARLQDGALEGSNVSAVETMVAMIAAGRQFEHQMKLLQTAERQEQAAAKLLSANGM
jgi:flagellar basal-body rod protein FlgF